MRREHLDDVYEELFLYGLVRKKTLDEHVQKLYPYLLEKARNEDLVSYEEATNHLGTTRQYLGRVLGAINECEDRKNNPLLTAIVVKDTKIDGKVQPSLGFFTWPCIPEEHWVHPDTSGYPSKEQLEYWKKERERVWSTWTSE